MVGDETAFDNDVLDLLVQLHLAGRLIQRVDEIEKSPERGC